MLLQIHDELVIESPLAELEETSATVRRVMEQVVELKVPLVVDLASATSLDAVKS
jgi:DNA polymerase I